jgi:hypothetical protein
MSERKRRNKPSREPQQLHGGLAWYYEYPGSIEVIVPKTAPMLGSSENCHYVRIPLRMLRKSLSRMRPPSHD